VLSRLSEDGRRSERTQHYGVASSRSERTDLGVRRRWYCVVMCAGSAVLMGCSTIGQATIAQSRDVRERPSNVVEAALHRIMDTATRFRITIEQTLPDRRVASFGTGTLDPPISTSKTLIDLAGGGHTLVEQNGASLRLKSYNTPQQLLRGQWVYLNEGFLSKVLIWPPVGIGDPAYLFVSADWPKVLANNLVSVRVLGNRRINGVLVSGYQLNLRLFKSVKNTSPRPQLECWIDGDNRLRLLTLRWPSRESTTPGNGNVDAITVTLQLATRGG
jgi:hypothetical protein